MVFDWYRNIFHVCVCVLYSFFMPPLGTPPQEGWFHYYIKNYTWIIRSRLNVPCVCRLKGTKELTLIGALHTHLHKHMLPRAGTCQRSAGTPLCHHVVKARWICAACLNLTDQSAHVSPDGWTFGCLFILRIRVHFRDTLYLIENAISQDNGGWVEAMSLRPTRDDTTHVPSLIPLLASSFDGICWLRSYWC